MRLFQGLTVFAAVAFSAQQQFDVVVYGGTAGGVITAVSAAREGLRTALLEPGNHLGGMVSGGLGWTDFGKKEVIGGYGARVLRSPRYVITRCRDTVSELAWMHEPHVAENTFREMLKEAGVTVFERHRLREKTGVRKEGAVVREITMENGATFTAHIFVDSSYEGDLMAQSGVTYTWGREGVSQYGESLAGVREKTPLHQFMVDVSPLDANGKLLPEISAEKPGPPGSADKKVQAYNFRLCLSEVPSNQVTPLPNRPDTMRSVTRCSRACWRSRTKVEGKVPDIRTVLKVDRLPNGKSDINNQGAFSTDYIGGSWEYPEASYAKRAQIWQAHKDYIAGLLYFLANDPQVPEPLRKRDERMGSVQRRVHGHGQLAAPALYP